MGGFGSYRELDNGGAVRIEGTLKNILIDHFSPTSPPSPATYLQGHIQG